MDNANDIIASTGLQLSPTDLNQLRLVLINSVKRIDKILSSKDISGRNLALFIINGSCDYYNITSDKLKEKSRKPQKVHIKRTICYLLRTYTNRTYKQVAEVFGYRDHTSVIDHVKDMGDMLSDDIYGDKEVKTNYNKLLTHLGL